MTHLANFISPLAVMVFVTMARVAMASSARVVAEIPGAMRRTKTKGATTMMV